MRVVRLICILVLVSLTAVVQERGYRETHPSRREELGKYFVKKKYIASPLPQFEQMRSQLPSPIYDENPLWTELYWKAWAIAFKNFHEPGPESGFVSQFIDAAFNDNVFLWDTSFMTMFCSVAHPLVPGIASLDNFYVKQHESGEICREIQRESGLDFIPWANANDAPLFSRWGWLFPVKVESAAVAYKGRSAPSSNPRLTLDALNNPMLSWAELESYRMTGDSARLRLVWEPLVRYYRALEKFLTQGNGLYITDWASMDNSLRNPYLDKGGTGVDISSQMVHFARNLSKIARILGRKSEAVEFTKEADLLAANINMLMWDERTHFYHDLTIDGTRIPVRTAAAYWTLLGKVASKRQAKLLVDELKNPATFGRVHPVPTCSADEPGFVPTGGYWRGAVWAPTNTMVLRGLENYGYNDLAREIALKHLAAVADVYKSTGTIWECYAADSIQPATNAEGGWCMKDFVGWSGIGPILFFMEYGVGLKPDAPKNELRWHITSHKRVGCEQYRFNRHVVTLITEPSTGRLIVNSDGAFTLRVLRGTSTKKFAVNPGANTFSLKE